MKKFITLILVAMMSGAAFAAGNMFDGMSQEELSNYEITITDKRTGKVVGKMSRAEYKVVKIGSGDDFHMTMPVPKGFLKKLKEENEIIRKHREGSNSVIIHAGVGNDGLDVNHTSGSNYRVQERQRAVGGATLCRSKEGKGVCASAFTNETYTLGVKFDF